MRPRPGEFDWTADRIALLKHWWSVVGLTGSEIGRRLGTSKRSAIGKAHREGFKQARTKSDINRDKMLRGAAAAVVPRPLPRPVKPLPPPTIATRVPFINARFDQCHYPLWEYPHRTGDVCGAETGGGPFCAFHTKVCRRSLSEVRAGVR